MGQKKHTKDIFLLSIFVTAAFLVGVSSFVINSTRRTTETRAAESAEDIFRSLNQKGGVPTPTAYFFPTPTRLPSRPIEQLPGDRLPRYPLFPENDTPQGNTSVQSESKPPTIPGVPQLNVRMPSILPISLITPELVNKLQETTGKPLETAKTAAILVKSYDKQLEITVNSFIQGMYRNLSSLFG